MRVRLIMWVALSLLGPAASRVSAVERGPALNWVRLPGAETCIAAVELAQRVEERLGRAVFVRASDAIVVIEGRIEPAQPLGFTTVIRVSDPDGTLYGTREIELADVDCRKLDEVLALVISVTIHRTGPGTGIELPEAIARELDRLFERDSSELDPATLPATAPPLPAADVQAQSAPPTAASPGPGPALEFGVQAGMFLVTGLQPSASFGPLLAVRLSQAEIGSVALFGRLGVPVEQSIEDGGTLEYSLLQGALTLCGPAWVAGTSELALCGSAALGSMHVAPDGFSVPSEPVNELLFELGPLLAGRTRVLGSAYLELAIGAPLRVMTPDFQYIDTEARTQSAFVMSRVGLTLELTAGISF